MKFSLKAVLVVIAALSLAYWLLTIRKAQKPHEDIQPLATRAINDKSELAPDSLPGTPPTVIVPTGINFKGVKLGTASTQLQPIFDVVSNAVLSVDRILKSKDYQVHEFSRTFWLISEDKGQSTVWKIYPYRTNAVVNSVEAIVYQDAAMTQKDLSKTFQMVFDHDTGSLRAFSWGDKHEVLQILTNGNVDYGRNVGEQKRLTMRWNAQGGLLSSNNYNWAKRGRVISGTPSAGIP